MKIRFLLAAGEVRDAQAQALVLGRLGHEAIVVRDGRDVLSALAGDRFDAVLLDLEPARGLALVRRLRAARLTLPVVLVADWATSEDRIEALDAGADDLFARPALAGEIAARVNAAIRGRKWGATGTDALHAAGITVAPAMFRAWREGHALDLAKTEFLLLAEFVRNANAVLSRATLVDRVWGRQFDPRSNIVDAHVRRLRAKLTRGGGCDPIATVRGVGYALRG